MIVFNFGATIIDPTDQVVIDYRLKLLESLE